MKKKKPYGDTLKAQLIARSKDRLYKFILADKTVRGAIVNGTRMVNEMRANHELGILETLVLGHGYLAATLLCSNLKGEERIGLQIDCTGPIKGLSVEANAFGEVRGYLKQVPIPIDTPLESFNLTPFFKAGFLTVNRYLAGATHPFSGNIDLAFGSIAKDLANYYLTSEQIPTAVHLSVQFDREGEVIGAGGLLIQAMPGIDEDVMTGLEKEVHGMPSLGLFFAKEGNPQEMIEEHLGLYAPRFLDSYRVEFMCRCNEEQLRRMLLALPDEDFLDMRENGPFPVEIRCHNCNSIYQFDKPAIESLSRERSTARSTDSL